MQLQQTLRKTYRFEGKGLHTGKPVSMTLNPAPVDTGIVFRRTDLPECPEIEALAEYVTNTARSTTISDGKCTVVTVEHILSALTGLGIDNTLIEINSEEVPILDGSAFMYVDAISKDGPRLQDKARKYIELSEEIEIINEKTGSILRLTPANKLSYDVQIDFDSKVVGVQKAQWCPQKDYAKEIAPCRTFVFFHELEYLLNNNLIKGGDVDNAIVVVEHPVGLEQLERMSVLFNKPKLRIDESGYLNNLRLYYPNECARHKLLDLIGDLRLCGGFLKARITAVRPGHTINTNTAKAVREQITNYKRK